VTQPSDTSNASYAARNRIGILLRLLQTLGTDLIATIDGVSMTPTIAPGTRVLLRRVCAHSLRSGDVVAFEFNGRLMAHRIVRVGRNRGSRQHLLTRGDAMQLHDIPVRLDSVIGIVTAQQIAGTWVALGRERDHRVSLAISGLIAGIICVVFQLSPTAAARLIRCSARLRAWTASRRVAPALPGRRAGP
jgi:signal peptidase I